MPDRPPERRTSAGAALLMVDFQARLLPAILDADRVVRRAARLSRMARALGVPTFATEQVPSKLGPTVEPIASTLDRPIPSKVTFHALGAPGLVEALEASKIAHVALAGIEAHVCVAQTAIELMARGFAVQVAVDAVGSRFADDRDVALRRLERLGAELSTVEAIAFEWAGSADHPGFRPFSAIVKERREIDD